MYKLNSRVHKLVMAAHIAASNDPSNYSKYFNKQLLDSCSGDVGVRERIVRISWRLERMSWVCQ